MASTVQSPAATLRSAWLAQAQANPWITIGLAATAVAVLLLLLAGAVNAFQSSAASNVRYALLGGSAGFVSAVCCECMNRCCVKLMIVVIINKFAKPM